MRTKNNLNETVGSNIKAWRHIKDFKQEYLASKIGLSKSSLSHIENGRTEITVGRLLEIAEVLEIDMLDLFKNPYELLTQLPPASPEINSSNNGVK